MPGEHWHTAGQVRRWGQPAKDQDGEDGPGGIAQIAPEPFSGPPPP